MSGTGFRILAVLVSLVIAGCSPLSREAGALMSDIAAGPGPSALKRETPAPVRRAIRYHAPGAARAGDLYLSPEGARAGLVLVPGLAAAGKDDPRLVALAISLARVRFAVLVPDIANLKNLHVRPEDAAEIADAARWLGDQRALAPEGRLGLVAISYAVGPALIAALTPALRDRLRFLVAVGGYWDMTALITFFTTGYFRVGVAWHHLEPNAYGKWLFVRGNLGRVADPGDRARLAAMAARKLDRLDADIGDLVAALGGEGRAIYDLLVNRDPARVPALIERLSLAMRRDIRRLDPSALDLTRLGARLILIHGRDDDIIPYSESLALARAMPRGQAALYLVDGLWHVDTAFTLADRLTLWDAAIDLLEQRGGAGG